MATQTGWWKPNGERTREELSTTREGEPAQQEPKADEQNKKKKSIFVWLWTKYIKSAQFAFNCNVKLTNNNTIKFTASPKNYNHSAV